VRAGFAQPCDHPELDRDLALWLIDTLSCFRFPLVWPGALRAAAQTTSAYSAFLAHTTSDPGSGVRMRTVANGREDAVSYM
jgi:hypothetical protein